jgi:hypothetical protein
MPRARRTALVAALRVGDNASATYFGSKKSPWTVVLQVFSVACSVASIHIDAPACNSRRATHDRVFSLERFGATRTIAL